LRRQFLAKEVLDLVPSLSPQASAAGAGGGKEKGKKQQQEGQQEGGQQQQQQPQHSLIWVTDFPMFEYDEEQKR